MSFCFTRQFSSSSRTLLPRFYNKFNYSNNNYNLNHSIKRTILFSVGLSSLTIIGGAKLTNDETQSLIDKSNKWLNISNNKLKSMRELELFESLQNGLNDVTNKFGFLPEGLHELIKRCYILISEHYLSMDDGQRLIGSIIAVNSLIFGIWQLPNPAIQAFMSRHFIHSPNNPIYTSLTSIFSHKSVAHLGFNMLALYSFGPLSYNYLERQTNKKNKLTSTTAYEFLSLYITSGLFSNLTSITLGKMLSRKMMPSLGASGAIYSTLTITGLSNPDIKVNLIFLPWFAFPISSAVAGMVTFDSIGLFCGWKLFDHGAHLGGALFGLIGYQYFNDLFLHIREVVNK